MPQVTAQLKHLDIAPKKVRRLTGVLKGMAVVRADAELRQRPQRASIPLRKLIRSAVANAEHNFRIPKSNLYVARISVDPGPSLKRGLPRAFGRTSPLWKRTSHVTVVLDSREPKAGVDEALKEPAAAIFEGREIESKERIIEENREVKTRASKVRPRAPVHEKMQKASKRGFMQKVFRRKAI